MHCRPRPNQVLPAVVHPTKQCVKNTYATYEVPHIHPTHTTIVNNELFQHKHYFPQTQSMVNNVQNQQFNCGTGPVPPMGPMGPMGPGM
ncbi:CotD [Bacillus coahuilensis m2-6]|uniref:CotD family spore coat protein n=1 Tax=Bacillus coahuilensis TaxID=408580 RepID=UPI0007504E1E|nr:CotD family spore coat protein [Bacillus coahuilensis]KUP08018.1 CotD [Bacillus coahuilensis m2-6]